MPTNILMPALSPTMEKGKLARWLKKEGDQVRSGDVIAEIETDKATMEVEAVDEGKLGKIIVPEGTDDVAVNTPIAVILGEGEDASAIKIQSQAPTAARVPEQAAPPSQGRSGPAADNRAASPAPVTGPMPHKGNGRVFSSPLARRLAKQHNLDIALVKGSGPHGRIIARDIEASKPAPMAVSSPQAAPAAATGIPDAMILKIYEPGTYEVVPHDGMRKIIASRLVLAKQTIPHFYLTISCALDALLGVREKLNAHAPQDKQKAPLWKLSVNDFVIKSMALALQRVPDANVTWTEAGMLRHKASDVGVAVAIEGGLFTPIIRKAETKTLAQISAEMKDLAARARNRRLAPHEYQGGTTAISNLGMYGIQEFSAVINPPHATILAVGAGEKRAVVESDTVVVRTMMTVTLSCDHRAVDGALGSELLRAFKSYIEDPALMLA
ncbi:MAG TPA: pyruvate dehydrogenase complex dihydrolipoamide acetyltransferase [Aestuariivirgaceae bacterium]|nr:pyruvate dehydrogenase complex dihydrolipoamide acetyltransferase [Aestuariivirgaceae bacterium]